MTTHEDPRRAHELIDEMERNYILTKADLNYLRSFLPELPKQKTLEEIHKEVYERWLDVEGNLWDSDNWGTVEEFLGDLLNQLKALIDDEQAAPAPPEGMRLADHEARGEWEIQYSEIDTHDGAGLGYVGADALSFLEASPISKPTHRDFLETGAAPAHPEFLETEADYENAPDGTIVAADKVSTAWIKTSEAWHSTDGDRGVRCPNWKVGHRIILRWGWKK